MNVDAVRHFYDYHFTENRNIWDRYIMPLSYKQVIQEAAYSHGSVRDQIVHLMSMDERWFSELQGVAPSEPLPSVNFDDRDITRSCFQP